jgi:hypothetical protein
MGQGPIETAQAARYPARPIIAERTLIPSDNLSSCRNSRSAYSAIHHHHEDPRGASPKQFAQSTAGCALALGVAAAARTASATSPLAISISPIGAYASGVFVEAVAEFVAHDPWTQRLFVVNAKSGSVDVLDIRRPSAPKFLFSVDVGGVVNSVDVYRGVIVAAVEADTKTDPGKAVFFNANGNILASVHVGALPDMVTFTPNGKHVLVANEGEPNDAYDIDPEGSVSIIDLPRNIRSLKQANVRTASFTGFNHVALDPSVRIFGPDATVAQDLEPEYITLASDSKTAWVSLQENNAIARLNIESGRFTSIRGLGFKKHALAGNELDASDRDKAIHIANWPVFGMYMPDAIASYEYRGRTFIVTANEGDARDYEGFSEEERVKDRDLDHSVFPNAAELKKDESLGRLTVTTANGVNPKTGLREEICAFGGRSFSIWDANLKQVYDSGERCRRRAHHRQRLSGILQLKP